MNPQIFREYDIRGIAGEDLNEENVFLLARAVGTLLARQGNTDIVLGRDCRLTSDSYAAQAAMGLMESGCNVTDIGVCPSPLLYFAIHHLSAQGGVMVTASHNPPEYNGFKMCSGTDSIHGAQIRELLKLVQNKDFETGKGSIDKADVTEDYEKFLQKNISIKKKLRIGVDAGNGAAGPLAVSVLKRLGCEVHDIYCNMDGRFPNHEPDPTVVKNMADLISLVKEKNLDLGIGFDGDGDRLGVVDENGKMIFGDQLMIIFAREILSRTPAAPFRGQMLPDHVRRH